MTTVPATLNGYPVLHSEPDGDCFRVLVFRDGHPVHPYVVATWVPNESGGWFHGDYQPDLPSAMALFNGTEPEPEADEPDAERMRPGPYEPSGFADDLRGAGRGHLLGDR